MSTTIPWPEIPVPDLQVPELGLGFGLDDLPGEPTHWLIGIPLAVAVLGFTLPGRSARLAAWIAILGAFLALIAAGWQAYWVGHHPGPHTVDTISGLPFGELVVPLELTVHRLVALISVVVALIAFGVQIFARWYLWYDPRYRQFAATVSLFTASMLVLVHSADIVLTLIAWQVMGWCSFLLIGHMSVKDPANRAAGKALLITRIADVGMVLGLIILAAPTGSTSIPALVEYWSGGGVAPPGEHGLLTAGLIGVIVGVLGKSAQFPFQDWLPDAMHAPTPASALIHAATMVAAGTVVLAGLLPLLQIDDIARTVLAIAVAVSIVGGSILAFAQADLKRLLAWSTVSQVGVMLAGLSMIPIALGPDAVMAHLTSHALFKTLIFLAVGWLAVLTGGTAVMQIAGGARLYRSVRAPLAVGLLAMAGVPPTIGFASKELLMNHGETAVGEGRGLAAIIALAAVGASIPLTVAYCMRAWLILGHRRSLHTTGGERLDDFFVESEVEAEALGAEEAEAAISSSARLVVVLLMVLSVLGSALILTPVIRTDVEIGLGLAVLTGGVMIVTAMAVWFASRGVRSRDAAARIPAGAALASERGWGMSRLYHHAVVRPVVWTARGVAWAETVVLDGYLRGSAQAAELAGDLGEAIQPRRPSAVIAATLVAMLALGVLAVVVA